ncbi:putative Ig domain-containing protein [Melioribacter sp. OK-6-Me]|uniref:putative Ig domain-containing protein n=1 Tax=Melioribacter sp. OK-6-Me TaxID=3423433 RepID=UPI003EDB3183
MKKNMLVSLIVIFAFSSFSLAQVTISLPNAVGSPGTEVLFPITVSDLTGQDVTSFQFQINYNNDPAYITGISTTGTKVSGNSPTIKVDTSKGYLRVAWASSSPLSGDGVLLNIKIKFKTSGTTPLEFGDIVYDNGNINPKSFGPSSLTVNWVNGSATVSTVNNPPVFDPVEDKTVNEGEALIFTVNATDAEGDPITYSADKLPAGASFDVNTKTFTWTPGFNQAGTYEVDFIANDGHSSSVITVNILVNNVNVPPTLNLNTTSPVTIDEGETFELQLTATDPDSGETFRFFSLGTLPQGAELTADGLFTWTPSFNQAGTYTIKFAVMDGHNAQDSKDLMIIVNDANQPPVFTKTLDGKIVTVHNVPVEFSFQYEATDPEGDPITYAALQVPDGAGITATGLFTWTPTQDQANKTFTIIVVAFDTHTFVNDTSVVTTSPVVSVNENELPSEFALHQNYPNPFNPITIISYQLPEASFVNLKVYDLLGNEIETLVNNFQQAGFYNLPFNASKLTSGIYLYKLTTDKFTYVKQMMLVK